MYKETTIRLSAGFSAKTLQAKKERHDIFKMMGRGDCNQESTTWKGYHSCLMERSRIVDNEKLREFGTMKPALQKS